MESVLARLRKGRTTEMQASRDCREPDGVPVAVASSWHILLSDLAHLANSMEILVELARKGYARHLRGQPQLQADAVTYLDCHIQDKVHHGNALYEYVQSNFGPVAPLCIKRRLMFECFFELLLPVVSLFFRVQPGLATLLILCYEKVALYYYEALSRAALREGLLELASLTESLRKDQARHALGMAALLELAPIQGWASRVVARTLIALCHGDISTSLDSSMDPDIGRALRTIKLDVPWYAARLDHVRSQMIEQYAMPDRTHGELYDELERIAF